MRKLVKRRGLLQLRCCAKTFLQSLPHTSIISDHCALRISLNIRTSRGFSEIYFLMKLHQPAEIDDLNPETSTERTTTSEECIGHPPATDTDIQQLQQFGNACEGIPQARHSNIPMPAPHTSYMEVIELAMAISASIHETGATSIRTQNTQTQRDIPSNALPSAPPIVDVPIDEKKEENSTSCVICLDAAVEGECIPCEHITYGLLHSCVLDLIIFLRQLVELSKRALVRFGEEETDPSFSNRSGK